MKVQDLRSHIYSQEVVMELLLSIGHTTETRYELLLGFAESGENKALFTDMTGFG